MGSSISDTTSLKEVQSYWEWYMENTQVEGAEFGSKEYFEGIRAGHEKAYSIANGLLRLSDLRDKKLLELACGIGLDTVEFAKYGADVTAIDISPMALELARKNLDHNQQNAVLEQGNVESMRFSSDEFDTVVARGIMMFTPDDIKVVDEIHRVLKRGGTAQVLFHKSLSWYTLLAKLSGKNLVHERKDPPINRLYSLGQVKRIFAKFSTVDMHIGRFPTPSRRSGFAAKLFNVLIIPPVKLIPKSILRPIGYYIVVRAVK